MFADCYKLHQTLATAFSGSGRILFRVEPSKISSNRTVIVLSENICIDNRTLNNSNMQTKIYDPVINEGIVYSFRLRANPTASVGKKRYPLNKEHEQQAWIARQSEKKGFSLIERPETTDEKMVLGHKGCDFLQLKSVLFQGRLMVTDAVAFKSSLFAGIGPGKGFGFGLLSIARR